MSESPPKPPKSQLLECLYLLALALSAPLLIFAHNSDLASASSLWLPLLISAALSMFSVGALHLLGLRQAALRCASGLLLLLFFSYGHLYNALSRLLFSSSALRFGETDSVLGLRRELHAALSFVFLLFFALSILILRKSRGPLALEAFLRAFSLSLCVIALISLLPAIFGSSSKAPAASVASPQASPIAASTGSALLRDIYYIILDGYARSDTLATYYHYDNSPFLKALSELGFTISDASHSNYSWTFLSLPSSLNMRYLPELTQGEHRNSTDRRLPYLLMRQHALLDFVRSKGYRYVHIGSTWGGTIDNQYADKSVSCQRSLFDDEFLRSFVEASWLRIFESFVAQDIAHCTLYAFTQLAQMAQEKGPKFVFAHFIPPHHPYLFDRQGNILQHVAVSNQLDLQNRLWGDSAAYLAQLEFVNQRILHIVRQILSQTSPMPIIVLQSDHGPHLPQLALTEQRIERLKNFTAVLSPDHSALLPSDVTPVNLFRHLLNAYFSANLPLLEQHSYASQYEKPYALEEVRP